jgi:hypothetical protein
VQRIRAYPGTMDDTVISSYMSNGKILQVILEKITNALHDTVWAIDKDALGILKDIIGTHSIHLGLAIAM